MTIYPSYSQRAEFEAARGLKNEINNIEGTNYGFQKKD